MFGKKRIEELERENRDLRGQVLKIAPLENQIRELDERLAELGALEHAERERRLRELERQIDVARQRLENEHEQLESSVAAERQRLAELRREVVETDDALILQEVGVYRYRHPLDDSTQYKEAIADVKEKMKAMVKAKSAVLATSNFTFNNSTAKGRTFVNDFSKLMLRAYNAEAENCIRVLKAGTLPSAEKRLQKTVEMVARLGRMIEMQIAPQYHRLRLKELALTADYLAKVQEEKEAARAERERLREEAKARAEFQREHERLAKERAHYANAVEALRAKGESAEAAELEAKLAELDGALKGLEEREANIRAGYVYVISNVGAFGERMVKIGMTRRLEPMDRINELGDASVPFRYDVHALFFSDDAVGIENKLHKQLESARVNRVNLRREFFYATPAEVKALLLEHAGNLLNYVEEPLAAEFNQSRGRHRVDEERVATGV